MPRGGSQPGERRGGRQKGTRNKKTAELLAAVVASGLTPLDYLLAVMRDEDNPVHVRLDAAKAAAHFIHHKLSAISHTAPNHDGQAKVIIVPAKELFTQAALSTGSAPDRRAGPP